MKWVKSNGITRNFNKKLKFLKRHSSSEKLKTMFFMLLGPHIIINVKIVGADTFGIIIFPRIFSVSSK